MTYTWQADVLTSAAAAAAEVSHEQRRIFEQVADRMIPATDDMPAASEVDVAGKQLDLVLRSRPDLGRPLLAALEHADVENISEVSDWLARLRAARPAAHDALVTVVLACYYLRPKVKELLGYPGQEPAPVSVGYPGYVEEGLLDAMMDQEPRYRNVSDSTDRA